jgi:hypothetical protein
VGAVELMGKNLTAPSNLKTHVLNVKFDGTHVLNVKFDGTHVLMVSSTAYYIKFDGFSPTFFNQFPVVSAKIHFPHIC